MSAPRHVSAFCLGLLACSSSSGTSTPVDAGRDDGVRPTDSGMDGAVVDSAVADVRAPDAVRASCTSWVASQRATDIRPLTPLSNAEKRTQFLQGGGGLRTLDTTYYAMWFPEGWFESTDRRVMFGLHGTGGAPEFEWVEWKDAFAKHGFAFVGLNYLLSTDAGGEPTYLEPSVIYAHLKTILAEMTQPCGLDTATWTMMGFSRGSVQGMRVVAADRADKKLIRGHLANSGGWGLESATPPPDLLALQTAGNMQALTGAKFWMYCGEQDRDHGWPMCDEMVTAQSFLTKYGAHVETLFRNPTGDHHSMYANATAVEAAFTYLKGLK